MRIIGGRAGGIRLESPNGRGVRPTEDRVKESMFSTLGDLTGKIVLDLFAGTGALGLEALSRGAELVHGFEVDRRHCEAIRKNIAVVERSLGVSGRYILHCSDSSRATLLPELQGKVDIVLADPPYDTPKGSYGWRELMMDNDMASMLSPDGMLVLEHGSDKEPPWYPGSHWRCLRTKTFGIRAVSYAMKET